MGFRLVLFRSVSLRVCMHLVKEEKTVNLKLIYYRQGNKSAEALLIFLFFCCVQGIYCLWWAEMHRYGHRGRYLMLLVYSHMENFGCFWSNVMLCWFSKWKEINASPTKNTLLHILVHRYHLFAEPTKRQKSSLCKSYGTFCIVYKYTYIYIYTAVQRHLNILLFQTL